MNLIDVNVLIYAFRDEMPEHQTMASFLNELAAGPASFGVPELALTALVRIVTRKPWDPPSVPGKVFDFCNALRAVKSCVVVRPSEHHWGVFERLCIASNARGKLVADAYLAALAVDRGDVWITTDRDFARFPGLRWRHPLEARVRVNPE